MTLTIDGVKYNEKYRAALEWDKMGGYYARLYYTSDEMHKQLNVPLIITQHENHYGNIDKKAARKRFASQVIRWRDSI
jgi:hypothetical protein